MIELKGALIMRILVLIIVLSTVVGKVTGQVLPDPPLVSPIQSGVYIPGLAGPRDYTDTGFSGIFAFDYNLFLSADKFIDRDGNEVNSIDFVPQLGSFPITVDITSYLNSPVVGYASNQLEWLGNARYMAQLAISYVTVDFRASYSLLTQEVTIDQDEGGFGDLTITPILLSWALGGDKADITAGYYFTAPTGKYETGADDNIGLGYWNHVFQVFAYYYPFDLQKATAIFIGNSLELHSEIDDVAVKPGSRYALEYGISQYLSPRWEVFVQGGNIWQIGEDSGNDVYWDTSVKSRYSNIGGGVGFWPLPGKLYSSVKYMTSYGERQHFNTSFWGVELYWVPWIRGQANAAPEN